MLYYIPPSSSFFRPAAAFANCSLRRASQALGRSPPSAGFSRRGGADGNTAPGKPGGRQLPPIPPIGFSTPPIEFSTPPIEISKPGIENPIGGVVGGASAREQTAAGVPISAVRGNFAEPWK